MEKNIILLSALLVLSSCYGDYVRDYDYSAAYVTFQYDMRTFVPGEDLQVSFTTALGGVISNDRDRKVTVVVDDELLHKDLSVFDPSGRTESFTAMDGLRGKAPLGTLSQGYVSNEIAAAGITSLVPLPPSHYTTSGLGDLSFKRGYHTAKLQIYPTEELFKDAKALKPYYAIGFQVCSADADSLVADKSFEVMVVKVENRFWGNWYHGGRRLVLRNVSGDILSDDRYALNVPQPDLRNYTLTTESITSVLTNKLSDKEGSLRLTFLENNEIKVEDNSGERVLRNILGQPSHHNGAKLIQDRKIYLNYAYSNGDGTTTYVTDTLAFRNRIRDGINEWQDENSQNYKE